MPKETIETTAQVPETVSQITEQLKEVIALKESFKVEQMTFVRNLINKDLTENELYMFLLFAKRAGLNPFAKEIIAVVYNGAGGRVVSTIVTRDGKRAVAYRQGGVESIETRPIYVKTFKVPTGRVLPNEPGKPEKPLTEREAEYADSIVEVEPWEGGKLWGATCTVKRNGKTHTATVPLIEYNTGRNVWIKSPETMIKKVAESQALSMAVPELLGTYDEAEMPSEARTIGAAVVEGATEPATAELITTIKAMGGDETLTYTKQGAMEEIARLQNEKRKAKKEVAKE